MAMTAGYIALMITLAGLVVGSFLNVVIYRLPRGESLAMPGSHCPFCGHAVRWYDNIPVVSFLWLRGRCHDCDARISIRYPLVEVLTGGLFLGAFLAYGVQWRTLEIAVFFAALIAVTFIDFDRRIIPDKIVLPGAAAGIVTSVLLAPDRWWQYVAAGAAAAGFLFALGMLWPGGMGFGDVKLALFMGVVLGSGVIVALFVAFLAGGVIGGALMVAGVKKRTDKIPFGPYLSLGAAAGALSGGAILDWYLRLF